MNTAKYKSTHLAMGCGSDCNVIAHKKYLTIVGWIFFLGGCCSGNTYTQRGCAEANLLHKFSAIRLHGYFFKWWNQYATITLSVLCYLYTINLTIFNRQNEKATIIRTDVSVRQ